MWIIQSNKYISGSKEWGKLILILLNTCSINWKIWFYVFWFIGDINLNFVAINFNWHVCFVCWEILVGNLIEFIFGMFRNGCDGSAVLSALLYSHSEY